MTYSREEVEAARERLRAILRSPSVVDGFHYEWELEELAALSAHIEALEAALRAAHSVLDDMLGPCEPGCDCVLHELRSLLPEDSDE